jgi:hypothetical protein
MCIVHYWPRSKALESPIGHELGGGLVSVMFIAELTMLLVQDHSITAPISAVIGD